MRGCTRRKAEQGDLLVDPSSHCPRIYLKHSNLVFRLGVIDVCENIPIKQALRATSVGYRIFVPGTPSTLPQIVRARAGQET